MHIQIPVDPDREQAREWAETELSGPEYTEEGQSWLDSVLDWITDLLTFTDGVGVGMPPLAVLIGIVVIAGVIALIVWLVMGPLRSSPRAAAGAALDPDDTRSAAQMREAAQRAAAAHDWDTAVMEMFRATARRAHDHSLIDLSEGMTAREAATAIASAAAEGQAAISVAMDFDTARYGTGGLSEEAWQRALQTDTALAHSRGSRQVTS